MENNLDSLVKQAKNNINILGVNQVENDDGGETLAVCISYEFQYRPRAGVQPHWVKTCDIINPGAITGADWVRSYVLGRVKEARAGLEE